MIQRIQSIFLLIVSVSFFLLFFLPFATTDRAFSSASSGNNLFADQAYTVQDHVLLMILAGLGGVLALVSLFSFKRRKRQLRLGYILTILGIMILLVTYTFFINASNELPSTIEITDQPGMYLPAASILAALLANRYIKKDDKLVESMDRLR
jgi:peptidoglycan/LPS O-acetylase OafA/YrhL